MIPASYHRMVQPIRFMESHRGTGLTPLSSRGSRNYVVWHPDALAQIFRGEQRMWFEPSDTFLPLVGARSLLFSNGERHVALRQVIGPALRGRSLDAYRAIVTGRTEEALADLVPGTDVSLTGWGHALALRIIGQIVLGDAAASVLPAFSRCVDSMLSSPLRTIAYRYLRVPESVPSPWRAFLRNRAALDRSVLTAVAEPAARRPATLSGLLQSAPAPLGALDQDELRDQVVSLLLAGYETTASSVAWAMYWLGRDDRLRAELRDELAATSADGADPDDVPLLDAVCRETLRISSPSMVAGTRVLTDDMTVLGRPMAAGTGLMPCIYLAHRNPEIYPEPDRFDPSRFLTGRLTAREYLPFGGGTRRCLGADLAMMELRMIVAALLRGPVLRRVTPEDEEPRARGPVLAPRTLLMRVER